MGSCVEPSKVGGSIQSSGTTPALTAVTTSTMPNKTRRHLASPRSSAVSALAAFIGAATLAVVAVPRAAHADEPEPAKKEAKDPAKDPQVARLLEAKKTMRWNQTLNGTDRYGHAEALVDAPADKVAKHVMDFGKYKELHKKFSTARVIGKEGDQTDVYMRYPVVIGLLKIELHEVMRFGVDRESGGVHTIEAFGVKGDMKRGHTRITIKPVDAKHSILQVDILLVPTLPAPQSFIDEELRDGAADYVASMRDKAQGLVGPVVSL